MNRSPIDAMIDRLDLRCTRCNTPKSVGCQCWEPIILRCPACGRKKNEAHSRAGDVVVDGVVELKCPDCWDKEGTEP